MKTFRSLLVWIEKGTAEPVGLTRAASLARETGARLTLVRVVDPPGAFFRAIYSQAEDLEAIMLGEWGDRLEALAEPLREEGLDVEVRCLSGKPSLELIREVLRAGHDLLIKPAQHDDEDRLFGSTDMDLLRKAPCAVWICKPSAPPATRILATIDPQPEDEALNRRILETGTSLAALRQGTLDVLHVWDIWAEHLLASRISADELAEHRDAVRGAAREALDATLERCSVELPSDRVHLLKGEARRLIPEFVRQREIGLVVMGTVSRTGVHGLLLGNTAEDVLSRVPCSVLALKPEGFVSPVELDG